MLYYANFGEASEIADFVLINATLTVFDYIMIYGVWIVLGHNKLAIALPNQCSSTWSVRLSISVMETYRARR